MENAISIRDIAFKMIKLSGSNIKLRFDTANDSSKQGFRKGESTLMDAEKIMNLGWKPAYFFEDTLEKLMTSMKDSR
jgi:nucleoside-diphosphate-sugar epimerase